MVKPAGAVTDTLEIGALNAEVLVNRNVKVMGVATVATTGDVAVSGDETVTVKWPLGAAMLASAFGARAVKPTSPHAAATTAGSSRPRTRCERSPGMADSRCQKLLAGNRIPP